MFLSPSIYSHNVVEAFRSNDSITLGPKKVREEREEFDFLLYSNF